MKQVEVYTDGACSGNPGPGGWGAVLRYRFNGKVYEKELSGGDASTTNNRMELTAFIEALRQLKEPCEVRLCSDSQYVINGLENGWGDSEVGSLIYGTEECGIFAAETDIEWINYRLALKINGEETPFTSITYNVNVSGLELDG